MVFGKKKPVESTGDTAVNREAEEAAAAQAAAVALAAQAEREREEMLMRADRFMKIDLTEVPDVLDRYRKLIKNLPQIGKDIKALLTEVKELWGEINIEKLQINQQAELYRCLAEELPKLIDKSVSNFDNYSAHYYITSEFHEIKNTFMKVIAQQIHPTYVALPVTVVRQNSFPELSWVNQEVESALMDLGDLWERAYPNVLTVEDRFFLDQITLSYLPDLWRMYAPFHAVSEPNRAQAQRLLIDQVGLLAAGVQKILDRNTDTALGELKAHKLFLTDRLSREEQLALS